MQMSSFAFSDIIIKVIQWTLFLYQFYKNKLSKSRDMIVYHMSCHNWNCAIGCHGNRNDLLLLLETYTILWNWSWWTIFASIHISLVKWKVRLNQHMTYEWHDFFCHAFPENVISCQLVPFRMNRLIYCYGSTYLRYHCVQRKKGRWTRSSANTTQKPAPSFFRFASSYRGW